MQLKVYISPHTNSTVKLFFADTAFFYNTITIFVRGGKFDEY